MERAVLLFVILLVWNAFGQQNSYDDQDYLRNTEVLGTAEIMAENLRVNPIESDREYDSDIPRAIEMQNWRRPPAIALPQPGTNSTAQYGYPQAQMTSSDPGQAKFSVSTLFSPSVLLSPFTKLAGQLMGSHLQQNQGQQSGGGQQGWQVMFKFGQIIFGTFFYGYFPCGCPPIILWRDAVHFTQKALWTKIQKEHELGQPKANQDYTFKEGWTGFSFYFLTIWRGACKLWIPRKFLHEKASDEANLLVHFVVFPGYFGIFLFFLPLICFIVFWAALG